jgi:hypothetical protein
LIFGETSKNASSISHVVVMLERNAFSIQFAGVWSSLGST